MSHRALLLPGFGGSRDQPILVALADALATVGIGSRRESFNSTPPSRDYARELAMVDQWRGDSSGDILIGRSFGGRICTFSAVRRPPAALVVLAYPIRPPGKQRPLDERALQALLCPTLIVQGDGDELGPLDVLRACTHRKRCIDLAVLPATGHDFGARTRLAVELTFDWLLGTLPLTPAADA